MKEDNRKFNIMLHPKSIKFFRSLKNVSCRELAEVSDVGESLLSMFETKRRKLTQHSNYRLIKAFQSMGFELDELLVLNLYVIQKCGGAVVTNEEA